MTIFKFPSNCCANFWVVLALCVYLQEGQVMYFDVNKTAKLVKKLREDAGLKQEVVASDMGINIKTYQAIEQGKRSGRIDTLCIIADYYSVTLDYLVTGTIMQNDVTKILERVSNENKSKVCKIIESIIRTLEL